MDRARRARTRGPRVGIRTRGGGRGTANAEVVGGGGGAELVNAGRGRAVLVGGHDERCPHAIDELNIGSIVDCPTGEPSTKKRRRSGSPHTAAAATTAAPSSPVMDPPSPEMHTSAAATTAAPSSPIMDPPSPGMFLECDEQSSIAAAPPTRSQQDAILFNYGSEPESESDEEELVTPFIIPRTERFLMETPQYEDDDVALVNDSQPPSATGTSRNSTTPLDTDHTATDSTSSGPAMGPNFYDFEWTPFPNPPLKPELRRETFSESNVGPTTPCVDPYDIFTAIWDRQIMEHIVSETNRYARELPELLRANDALRPQSRILEWRDTTTDELYAYLAIVLAMGIVVKSRIEAYWSANPNIFCTPYFRAHMSLRRFQLLSRCLHFNCNEDLRALNVGSSEAKIFKIKPVVSHLNKKFQQMYNLQQNIALDESLLQWKGWLSFNQFIPNKAAKVGVKTYEVCESQTGYLWRFEVHADKSSQQADPLDPLDAFTPKLVLKLLHGLENKGHTIWMDNFYNSPALARKLKTLGFDCVGTLRTNRQFVPEALNQLTKEKMRPGTITGLTSGDVDVMVWRDKNRVATISTYHGNTVAQKDGTMKPTLVWDYNVMMGGVDQMLATYPVERKRTRIWYKKFFRRLLNVSVLNSYIICKRSSSNLDHYTFRESLILTLLNKHATNQTVACTPQNVSVKYHHLGEIPLVPGNSLKPRRACNICKKRVQTRCVGCDKPVCMTPCFVKLHGVD